MFGSLFGKKKKDYFICKVMMTRPSLDNLLLQGVSSGNWMVITFFNVTRQQLIRKLNNESLETHIVTAESILSGAALPKISSFLSQGERTLVFGERHPLTAHETTVAERLEQSGIALPIVAYASLDDALLQHFGGERVKSLMVKMGMSEEEIIEHSMIEKSIENAQDKIAKKVVVESKSASAEDWFRLNLSIGI